MKKNVQIKLHYTTGGDIEWIEGEAGKKRPVGKEKRSQHFVQRLPVKQLEDIEKVKNHGSP